MRRVDRAAADDHLAPGAGGDRRAVAQIFHADRPFALEEDAGSQCVGLHADVRTLHGGPEEGARGGHAAAALGRNLIDADAVLACAVEVLVEGEAGFAASFQIVFRERMNLARAVGDVDRPAASAPLVLTGLVVLDRLEHWQQIVIAPAGVAGCAPIVEILRMPAHPDQGIDGARTAEQFSARPVVGIAGKAGIGLGPVVPVHRRIEEGLAVAERHLDEEAPVGAARLKYKDGESPAGRKPFGDSRSGRTGADHNEIIGLHVFCKVLPSTVRSRS